MYINNFIYYVVTVTVGSLWKLLLLEPLCVTIVIDAKITKLV